jgi:hypothetical protein
MEKYWDKEKVYTYLMVALGDLEFVNWELLSDENRTSIINAISQLKNALYFMEEYIFKNKNDDDILMSNEVIQKSLEIKYKKEFRKRLEK